MCILGFQGVFGILQLIINDLMSVLFALLIQTVNLKDIMRSLSVNPCEFHQVKGIFILPVPHFKQGSPNEVDQSERFSRT